MTDELRAAVTDGHPRPLRLPPYGRALLAMRLAGEVPREVFVASRWELGRAFQRIVIPDDLDPATLDLRALAGLDVTIVHPAEDAERVAAIVAALENVRPRLLAVLNVDLPSWAIVGGGINVV